MSGWQNGRECGRVAEIINKNSKFSPLYFKIKYYKIITKKY